jgi:NAD(P)-dependent dehydrogenase (short-subunit alcohol dehydrogenase family)
VRPRSGAGVYSLVKGAIGTLTRTLATELGLRGVRVNALAPASIPAPGTVSITPCEEYERRTGSIPLRLGHEEDNTMAALYLLSNSSSFVNGEILHVDGGVLAAG